MTVRRLRNVSGVDMEWPTLGVFIAAGAEAEIDFPAEQPCPAGLTESAAPAKAPEKVGRTPVEEH